MASGVYYTNAAKSNFNVQIEGLDEKTTQSFSNKLFKGEVVKLIKDKESKDSILAISMVARPVLHELGANIVVKSNGERLKFAPGKLHYFPMGKHEFYQKESHLFTIHFHKKQRGSSFSSQIDPAIPKSNKENLSLIENQDL